MADGTKSSDYADPKKKKAKSETKPGAKRQSAAAASAKKGRPAGKTAGKATKKSDDDLDIEHSGSGEGVEESD